MTLNEAMALKPGQRAKLDETTLAKAVSVMASVANKRLNALEKEGLGSTPAATAAKRSGGKFSASTKTVTVTKKVPAQSAKITVKEQQPARSGRKPKKTSEQKKQRTKTVKVEKKVKMDKNDLEAEYRRLAKFLDDYTSTLKGASAYKTKQESAAAAFVDEILGEGYYESLTDKQKQRLWDFYHRAHTSEYVKTLPKYKKGQLASLVLNEFMAMENERLEYNKMISETYKGKDLAKFRAYHKRHYKKELEEAWDERIEAVLTAFYEEEIEAEEQAQISVADELRGRFTSIY